MAEIRIAKPEAGQTQTIPVEDSANFVFDFPTDGANFAVDGTNLTITHDDGSRIVLENFYDKYNGENPPTFDVEGEPVAAADFFAAMNREDLATAAGAGATNPASGGRFHDFGNSALGTGIDHLTRLDYQSNRHFEWDDSSWITRPDRGWDGDDEGGLEGPANLIPNVIVPPSTPENPGDTPPGETPPGGKDEDTPGGKHFVAAKGSTIVADEAGLEGGSGLHTAHGSQGSGHVVLDVHGEGGGRAIISLSDGHNSIVLNQMGKLPVHGQRIALADNPELADNLTLNANGVDVTFTALTYNAATGKWMLEYDYKLTGSQEHGDQGSATDQVLTSGDVGESIAVQVTDFSGDKAQGQITVEVHDDVPVLTITENYDNVTAETPYENLVDVTSMSGTVTVNYGADGAASDSLYITIDDSEQPQLVEFRDVTLESGQTVQQAVFTEEQTGGKGALTLTQNADGTIGYEFEPKVNDKTTSMQLNFKLTAYDSDTDQSYDSTAVGINFRPQFLPPDPKNPDNPDPNDPVSATPDGKGLTVRMDEASLAGKNGDPNATHGHKGTATFAIQVNGNEDALVTIGGEDGFTFNIGHDDSGNYIIYNVSPDAEFANNGVKATFSNSLGKDEAGEDIPAITIDGNGKCTVTFSYELTNAQKHDKAEDYGQAVNGHDDKLPAMTLVVDIEDSVGKDKASGVLNFEIHDDGPAITTSQDKASSTQWTIEDGDAAQTVNAVVSLSGTVDFSFGADDDTPVSSLSIGGTKLDLSEYKYVDADNVEHTTEAYVYKDVIDGEERGTLTIYKVETAAENGETKTSWHYRYEPADKYDSFGGRTFDVKITDADGDFASAPITVFQNAKPEVPGTPTEEEGKDPVVPNKPAAGTLNIVVDEADWAAHNSVKPGTGVHLGEDGKPEHPYTGKASFTVKINGGENGTITIGEGESAIIIAVTKTATGYEAHTEGGQIVTANGVTLDFAEDGVSVNKDGLVTVRLSYELDGSREHLDPAKAEQKFNPEDPSAIVSDNSISELNIPIKVEDNVKVVEGADGASDAVAGQGGDVAYGWIHVEIHDDATKFSHSETTGNGEFRQIDSDGNYVVESGDIVFGAKEHYDYLDKFGTSEQPTGATKNYFKGIMGGDLKSVLEFNQSSTSGDWRAQGLNEGTGTGRIAQAAGNYFTMTASFVHYKYGLGEDGLHVDNVVEVANAIYKSGKEFSVNSEGLSVGGNVGWNSGNTEISAGTGTGVLKVNWGNGNAKNLLDNGHAQNNNVNASNVSEAVVFDLYDIAYGMDLQLGSLQDGDRVLVTFLKTPPNNDTNIIVEMVELTYDSQSGNFINAKTGSEVEVSDNGAFRIEQPEGFTKVFVSNIPNGTVTDSKGLKADISDNETGFTIKGVSFLTYQWQGEGAFEATSADGIDHYDWTFAAFGLTHHEAKDGKPETWSSDSNKATVHVTGIFSGDYNLVVTKEIIDGNEVWVGKLVGSGTLNNHELFRAELATDAEGNVTGWKLNQYYEFNIIGGTTPEDQLPFRVVAVDGDGDEATLILNISAQFTRFDEVRMGTYKPEYVTYQERDISDDVIVGHEGNTLIYGKGGNDVLIGDRLEGEVKETGDEAVNSVLNDMINSSAVTKNPNETVGVNDTKEHGKGETTFSEALHGKLSGLDDQQLNKLADELEKHENIQDYGRDAIYGSFGNDILAGAGGDDYLNGGKDDDFLFGGSGNDVLVGGEGKDVLAGGTGNDILVGDELSGGLEISSELAAKLNLTSTKVDLSQLDGDKIAELIKADPSRISEIINQSESGDNDRLFGGEGDDILFGGDGNDHLDGGTGNDMLFGGRGQDTLVGGEGNDYLDGGAGEDSILAGSGDDIIVFDGNDKVIDGGAGIDVVLAEGEDVDSANIFAKADNVEVVIQAADLEKLGFTSSGALAAAGILIVNNQIELDPAQWILKVPDTNETEADNSHAVFTGVISGQTVTIDIKLPEGDDADYSVKYGDQALGHTAEYSTPEFASLFGQDDYSASNNMDHLIADQDNAGTEISGHEYLVYGGTEGVDIILMRHAENSPTLEEMLNNSDAEGAPINEEIPIAQNVEVLITGLDVEGMSEDQLVSLGIGTSHNASGEDVLTLSSAWFRVGEKADSETGFTTSIWKNGEGEDALTVETTLDVMQGSDVDAMFAEKVNLLQAKAEESRHNEPVVDPQSSDDASSDGDSGNWDNAVADNGGMDQSVNDAVQQAQNNINADTGGGL